MKISFLLLFIVITLRLTAQENYQYVAIRTGLNLREKPDIAAKVLDKIPYATKIVLPESNESDKPVQTEGMSGAWRKVQYNGKTGFIVDSYLFPVPPPKAGIKTMKEYLLSITRVFGAELTVDSNPSKAIEEGDSRLTKQLYANGAEMHSYGAYEYSSTTFFLPGFTTQQAFLLLRLIPEFADYVDEKDEFVTKNKTVKKKQREYKYTVEKEVFGNTTWIKKIKIDFEDGAIYNFELYQIDNQVVIFYGAGV